MSAVMADWVAEAVRWDEKEGASADVHPNQAVVVEDSLFSFPYPLLIASTVASTVTSTIDSLVASVY